MSFAVTISATATFIILAERLLHHFDRDAVGEGRDSLKTSILATLLWLALLTPLVASYHQ